MHAAEDAVECVAQHPAGPGHIDALARFHSRSTLQRARQDLRDTALRWLSSNILRRRRAGPASPSRRRSSGSSSKRISASSHSSSVLTSSPFSPSRMMSGVVPTSVATHGRPIAIYWIALSPLFPLTHSSSGQRIEADVDRLQILDLPFGRPADDLEIDAGKRIIEIADDSQPEAALLRELLQHAPKQVEILARAESPGPADRHKPIVAVAIGRLEAVGVDRRRDVGAGGAAVDRLAALVERRRAGHDMIGLAHQEAVFSGGAKKAQQAIGMVAAEAVDMRHDIVFDVIDELRGRAPASAARQG